MIVHDPQAVLDYTWDWTGWLGTTTGDTITSAAINAPVGLNIDTFTIASPYVTAWISGGTIGTVYRVTCHIITAQGREDDWTLTFVCANK